MNAIVANEWINKALLLEAGEELYLPAETKADARTNLNAIRKELKRRVQEDPINISTIWTTVTIKENRYWTVLRRSTVPCTVGFVKKADGGWEKEKVSYRKPTPAPAPQPSARQFTEDEKRRLRLMLRDGMEKESICKEEYITMEELLELLKED